MEAIRNYLETMFLNLPNTPEVYKAKNELWQMMEDKYTELKNEGKSENEAVGTVIAEFGNLDELAEDLGFKQFVHQPLTGADSQCCIALYGRCQTVSAGTFPSFLLCGTKRIFVYPFCLLPDLFRGCCRYFAAQQ